MIRQLVEIEYIFVANKKNIADSFCCFKNKQPYCYMSLDVSAIKKFLICRKKNSMRFRRSIFFRSTFQTEHLKQKCISLLNSDYFARVCQ